MKKIIFLLLLFTGSFSYAQEVLDKVIAVVNNEVILKSELDFQTMLFASQKGLNPESMSLKKQVLNSMIEDKLVYAQALLDSITVTDDDVNRRIEYQMDMFVQQYGSKEKVEEVYGMSMEKIKRELRDDVRKNLMAQSLQQKKFGMVEASRREVEEFFNTYKDSLGMIPEKYTIAHIFVNPKASEKVKTKARAMAQAILDSVRSGMDFATMAKKYSEDPGTKDNGGDLGFTKRGRLVPEYESAAFALREGGISEVTESQFGFHIIQLLERKGEMVHTRHILIKIKNDEDDDLKAITLLNDLRDSVRMGAGTFEAYAKKYSDDKQTAKLGGVLGSFDINQLDKSLLEIVSKLKTGEISFPKRMEMGQGIYGYHIVNLQKKIPEHKADLNIDFNELKQLAEYNKQQKLYMAWMQELKGKIYWEVRL